MGAPVRIYALLKHVQPYVIYKGVIYMKSQENDVVPNTFVP